MVGPVPNSTPSTRSRPPTVSMRTTEGATRWAAAASGLLLERFQIVAGPDRQRPGKGEDQKRQNAKCKVQNVKCKGPIAEDGLQNADARSPLPPGEG